MSPPYLSCSDNFVWTTQNVDPVFGGVKMLFCTLDGALDQQVLEADAFHRARLPGLKDRIDAFERMVRRRIRKAQKSRGNRREVPCARS